MFSSAGANHSRKPGQGGNAETQPRDLRVELLAAEAAHQAKKSGLQVDETSSVSSAPKRPLQLDQGQHDLDDEDPDGTSMPIQMARPVTAAKRRAMRKMRRLS